MLRDGKGDRALHWYGEVAGGKRSAISDITNGRGEEGSNPIAIKFEEKDLREVGRVKGEAGVFVTLKGKGGEWRVVMAFEGIGKPYGGLVLLFDCFG